MSKKKRNVQHVQHVQHVQRAKARDAFSNPLARLGFETPTLLEGAQYTEQRITRNYGMLNALYREHWIVRRLITAIPEDMVKNWIKLDTELDPGKIKEFEVAVNRTHLTSKLKKGLEWGRLYGGAIGIMLIRGQGDDLSQPLDLDAIMPDDFKGLFIFDRWNAVEPSLELETDISDAEFGLPKFYTVTAPGTNSAIKVHHSRCVRFLGNDLPYWEEIGEQYWGSSVIESIIDELKKRDNVSWNIAQLTFMAVLRVLKMQDMGQLLSATDPASQAELYRTIQAQNVLASNMGIQIMDASDSLETHQYTFGGLADTYKQFMYDICGAAEIPATRLFGRSPEGMNATGDSDMQNYYEMISTKQDAQLRPVLEKLMPVISMSVWGAVPDDLDFEFNPVRQPNDQELADLAKNESDSVIAVYNAGLVSQQTALRELKQQSARTGIWTNITDEDIAKANDELEQPAEEGMGGLPPGMDEGQEPPNPEEVGGEEEPQKVTDSMVADGGEGSGNFNHAGRPGEIGGAGGNGGGSKKGLVII